MVYRIFEKIIAFVGLILLSPLFLIVAAAIVVDSRGPVFYRAERVGKEEKIFKMMKFRTMRNDAHKTGPPITTKEDERITYAGRVIRKLKLDELPQLVNVFMGQMGFVGPRPEAPDIVKKYTSAQRRIFQYRPGITSPASLTYRAEEEIIPGDRWEMVYINDILPKKLKTDIDYMTTATFRSDLKLILKTINIFKKNVENNRKDTKTQS